MFTDLRIRMVEHIKNFKKEVDYIKKKLKHICIYMCVCNFYNRYKNVYTLRKTEGKETHVPQCSSQHCL